MTKERAAASLRIRPDGHTTWEPARGLRRFGGGWVKVVPPAMVDPPVRHALVLPYATSSVAEARRVVRQDLVSQGVPPGLIEDGLYVLSELVANAVLHASPMTTGGIRVLWFVESGRMQVEVTDGGGPAEPHIVQAGPSSMGGRGLAIVTALARDWGVIPRKNSVTVYATVGD